jgi:hypothetical protein
MHFPSKDFVMDTLLMNLFLLCSDGKLEVVVPSFVHYLEVLEGTDGDKLPGVVSMPFYILSSSLQILKRSLLCTLSDAVIPF